jgi:hypothetical protein
MLRLNIRMILKTELIQTCQQQKYLFNARVAKVVLWQGQQIEKEGGLDSAQNLVKHNIKTKKEKPMDYYTKDGVKIEVGMELTTPVDHKVNVLYIHHKKEGISNNIVIEYENGAIGVWDGQELTSFKGYNGYGLLWYEDDLEAGCKDTYCEDALLNKKIAFDKLISHPGCRPFVEGETNYLLFYHHL